MGTKRGAVLAATVATLLLSVVMSVVTNYATSGPTPGWLSESGHAWWLLVCVLGLTVVVTIVTFRSGREPASPKADEAQEVLAGVVQAQWRAEARARLVADPRPIPVRWRSVERDVADLDWKQYAGNAATKQLAPEESSERVSELAAHFNELQRPRLVLLGSPGSGKTTLAIQLLIELLRCRPGGGPVPILLTLAGWDTVVYPNLWHWIRTRLEGDYPAITAYGPEVTRVLVEKGAILPILDGLDELDELYRPKVIAALNWSLSESDKLILTCRTTDFENTVAAGDVLTAATVLEAQPLNANDVASYLESCVPPARKSRWVGPLKELRSGKAEELAHAGSTPLGLWLLRTVYVDGSRDPLALSNEGESSSKGLLWLHLLDEVIPALIEQSRIAHADGKLDVKNLRHSWDDTEKVRRWLVSLARHLNSVGSRDIRWWRVARDTGAAWFTIQWLMLVLGGGVGACFGALVGLISYTIGADNVDNTAGDVLLLLCVLGGFTSGIVLGSANASACHTVSPLSASLRLRGRFSALILALLPGLQFGAFLCSALLISFIVEGSVIPADPVGWLFLFLVALGIYAFANGLPVWAETPSLLDAAETAQSTLRRDRALALLRAGSWTVCGVMCSIFFAILNSMIISSHHSTTLSIPIAVALIASVALGGAVTFGLGRSAWFSYGLSVCRLALRRQVPWRMNRFLGDMHQLGLLRSVGSAYQFRHAELQDRLCYNARRCSTEGGDPGSETTGQLGDWKNSAAPVDYLEVPSAEPTDAGAKNRAVRIAVFACLFALIIILSISSSLFGSPSGIRDAFPGSGSFSCHKTADQAGQLEVSICTLGNNTSAQYEQLSPGASKNGSESFSAVTLNYSGVCGSVVVGYASDAHGSFPVRLETFNGPFEYWITGGYNQPVQPFVDRSLPVNTAVVCKP